MESTIEKLEQETQDTEHGRAYCIFVDDVKYHFDHSPVTGGEIMDAAGIPYSVGLIQIFKDGTQKPVGVDEEVHLRPGCRFKKAPRFKRG